MTEPSYSHALPAGYRVHWYEITRVLAEGGFGVTYLARDLNLGIDVAIKEYLPNDRAVRLSDGETVRAKALSYHDNYQAGLRRFLDEGQALAEFDHPRIGKVRASFEANGTAYLVMRFEHGLDLNRRLNAGERFTEAQIKRMLLPILDGLEAVHEKGWIHRDIKPGNIIVGDGDAAVLTDFGAARQATISATTA